ncbi:uroporphyrinogen-III synthase [Salicola sp. Rm-C-2C1-2]|uniref:uroporphyrinogen-III synthase n=1 Tax=Salicola sp. Rm-C-2C1-2 TaxID=3141321 RepID=UPI0032E36DDA
MVTNPSNAPLAGRRILVSRPEPKATQTCRALEQVGARTQALPLIAIQPRTLDGRERSLIQELDNFQKVVAVSPNAAHLLMEQADEWWPQWPVGLEWWGPGEGTARVFSEAGVPGQAPAGGHNSEALLNCTAFQPEAVADQKILVARGEQGRELLLRTLTQRGARVEVLPLYARTAVEWPQAGIQDRLVSFDPDTVLALSGETLKHLLEVGQNTDTKLRQRCLVVPAERVAQQARDAGFRDVRVALAMSPDGLIDACMASSSMRSNGHS